MPRLTEASISKLRTPNTSNIIVTDGEIRGFGLRLTPGGSRSFVFSYWIHGRQRRYTIGSWPAWSVVQAREEVERLKNQVQRGVDPLAAKQRGRESMTIKDLADKYLKEYVDKYKRPSTRRNYRQMLTDDVIPAIGKLQVKAVSVADVRRLHTSLAKTPYKANRVLSVISAMFTFARENGIWSENPVREVERFEEDQRDAFLTEKQITALLSALRAYPDQVAADAIRLLLVTGSREGEVLNAQCSQFDLSNAVWIKPSHHTKQKRIERMRLNSDAVRIVKRLAENKKPEDFLFPGIADKKSIKRNRTTLRRPWVQVLKIAGLAIAEQKERTGSNGRRYTSTKWIPTIRIHDLRHTFASHLVSKGVSLYEVGKLLGHTQPRTTQRYAHLSDSSQQEATETFSAMLRDAGPHLIQ